MTKHIIIHSIFTQNGGGGGGGSSSGSSGGDDSKQGGRGTGVGAGAAGVAWPCRSLEGSQCYSRSRRGRTNSMNRSITTRNRGMRRKEEGWQ